MIVPQITKNVMMMMMMMIIIISFITHAEYVGRRG